MFALQAPFGLFGQLLVWASLLWVLFAVMFWSLSASAVTGTSIGRALKQSGSSMLTLGFDAPRGLGRQLTSFAAAGVGLTLLALVIAYIPTVYAAFSIADFLGIPHRPPEPDADIMLSEQSFDQACDQLRDLGVPVREDRSRSWSEFRSTRARYEPLLAVIGRMTDAPRSEWSSWSETAPRHRPPLVRPHRDRPAPTKSG